MQGNPYASPMFGAQDTLFGGNPPVFRNQFFDLGGFPGLNGPSGYMLQMMLQPFLSQYMSQHGFMPGQFQPLQNLWDHQRAQNHFNQNMQAVQSGFEMDRMHYVNTMRGIAHITNSRFGLQQMAAAQGMVGDIGKMMPMLVQMAPEFLDQWAGARGSNAVLAHYMHSGGRFARDPITGLSGLSSTSASQISSEVYRKLYGPGVDIGEMRGIGAGEIGRLYDELNRRGVMGGGVTAESTLAGRLGRAPTKTELDTFTSSAEGEKITKDEGGRIADKLKGYTGVIAALRDVFGDMGHPNAPIPELIKALQSLTQGGLSTMDAGQLSVTVRQMYNLSRAAGVGLEGMQALVSSGSRYADSLGLDRQFAVQASMGAVAYGHAFGIAGQGDTQFFGRLSKDRITVLDQQLRTNAAASPIATMLNVAAYLGDTGNLKAGSMAAAYSEAVRNASRTGATSFQFGGREINFEMPMEQFAQMMNQGGVDLGTVRNLMASGPGMQRWGAQYQTADIARMMQRRTDIEPILTGRAALRIQTALGADHATAYNMARAMVTSTLDMSNADYKDPNKQIENLVNALAGVSGNRFSRDQLRNIAISAIPEFDTTIAMDPRLRMYDNTSGVRDLHSKAVSEEALKFKREQLIEGQIQDQFSRLGRLGPLRRVSELLASSNLDQAGFGKLLSTALGGIPEEVLKELGGGDAKARFEKIRDLAARYKSTGALADFTAFQKEIGVVSTAMSNRGYRDDMAIGKEVTEDLYKAGKAGDARFLTAFENIAQVMALSKGNLAVLGAGAPGRMRHALAVGSRLNALVAKSGLSAEAFMKAARGGGTIGSLDAASSAEAKKLLGEAVEISGTWRQGDGRVPTGANAPTAQDERDAKDLLRMADSDPGELTSKLFKALDGMSPSGEDTEKVTQFLKEDPTRKIRVGLALEAFKKFKTGATLTEAEKLAAKPLMDLGIGRLDRVTPKMLLDAFPGAPGSLVDPSKKDSKMFVTINGTLRLVGRNTGEIEAGGHETSTSVDRVVHSLATTLPFIPGVI